MEDNQLVLAFRQLIRLIIDADKDLANSINSETIAREADVRDLISKITAEEQSRTSADAALDERILNLVTALNTEITERQTAISNLDTKLNESVSNLETADTELRTALNELKPKLKKVLVLSYGLDDPEQKRSKGTISHMCNCSRTSANTRKMRALETLRKNKELLEAFLAVDTDFDVENPDKTYYLQR